MTQINIKTFETNYQKNVYLFTNILSIPGTFVLNHSITHSVLTINSYLTLSYTVYAKR